MDARHGARAAVAGMGMAGVLLGAVSCVPTPSGGLTPRPPTYTSNGVCTQHVNPVMPPSTGTQTPSGFSLQMKNVQLGTASSSKTLAGAYRQFNDLTCTQYTHTYTEKPPRFYYYDCVGFTGYTVRTFTPTAWNSLKTSIGLHTGYVPTPFAFQKFMNSLAKSPQAGWKSVATVRDIRAGDVLAWQPALANGAPNMSGVGHSVMPLVTPRAIPGSNGTRWEVVVMDSTAGGHGPDDTRKPASPLSQRNAPLTRSNGQVQASGLGIGTLALDTDTTGKVTGIEWYVGAQSEKVVFGAARALS